MKKPTPARILDVGNCNPDHSMIRRMLEPFDVDIDRVMFVNEAIEMMRHNKYELVIFNRLIFEDGSPGIDLLHQARKDPALGETPIMMISNFDSAQANAVAAGAVPGFGKDFLFDPQTTALLARYLPLKITNE